MAVVEALHALDPLGAEPQALSVPVQERASQAAAEQEADQIARCRGEPDQPDQRRQLDPAALRHHAADHDGRLAGHQQAHERPGLEEGEPRDGGVGPGPERPRGLLECAVSVGSRDAPAGAGERGEGRARHRQDHDGPDVRLRAMDGGELHGS